MISIDKLNVSFGGFELFKEISFLIQPKDRIGLIGKNGAGKTTLLKIISGFEQPTSGNVGIPRDLTLGYLPQQMKLKDQFTLKEETVLAFEELLQLEKRIAQLNTEIAEREDYHSSEYLKKLDTITELNERYSILGGENYEAELLGIQKQRKEILKKAKEEADGLLREVNKKIENTIQEIKKAQAEKEKTKQAREKLENLKKEVGNKAAKGEQQITNKLKKLRQREENRNKRRPKESKKPIPKEKLEERLEIRPGDKVRIKGQDTIGDLIELNEKNVVVAFGQLMTTLPRENIQRLSNNEAKKLDKTRGSRATMLTENFSQRRLSFKPEIDIRGQRVEEAISNIQEFIDEAIMFEVGQLRILHGKGHGILKQTIRDFLRSEPMVRSYKDEHVDFGGAGITVVNLAL